MTALRWIDPGEAIDGLDLTATLAVAGRCPRRIPVMTDPARPGRVGIDVTPPAVVTLMGFAPAATRPAFAIRIKIKE